PTRTCQPPFPYTKLSRSNAPANIAVNNDAGNCTASVTFAATPSDNCGVASTVYKIGGSTVTSPHTFPVGSTTVDVLVTDIHGNRSNDHISVAQSPNQPPA